MAVTTETKRNNNQEEEDKDWLQILAIVIGCICAVTMGMLYAWPAPSITKIIEDKQNYDINLDEASYFTVISPIGIIISAWFFSRLNDTIGRKNTLLLIAIPQIISWILIVTAKSVYVFYLSRFISGIGDACFFTSLPIYIGEITTPKVRGTWGNAMTFSIYVGQLIINILGSYYSLEKTAYISVLLPVIFTGTFFFMPESPYFFIMKGRYEDAKKSLQKLRRKIDVDVELNKLKSDVNRQMSESGNWKDLFAIESNRRAVYAGTFLRASQQFGGITAFAMYIQYIFTKAGGDMSASTSAIIFSFLCAILNFFAALTLDKIGRQKSYIYSCLFCGLVFFAESVYFFIDQNHPEIDLCSLSWVPVAGMVLYTTFYSFGLGIVPTLMLGELFSASIKTKGLFLMNIIFAIFVSATTKLFHILETNIGLFAPFLFYSICCFVSTILAFYFVPETRGKTLEEIQQSLKSSNKKVKNLNAEC